MSISQNFPEEGPTLNLNFAGSRILDPRITFSRSQTTSNGSTYMGRDGLIKYAGPDEPRFDHRYVNGEIESLGLLIEEERTNLIIDSENQNSWSGFRTTVSIDQIFSPDGNMTADLITASETNLSGGARVRSVTPSIGTFTFSVFAKKNTTSTLLLRPQSTNNFSQASDAYFDLETGEKTGVSDDGVVFTNSTQDIEYYGNDWYRCSVTFTLTSANFTEHVRIYVVDNSGSLSVTSGASFYIWGAQLEEGSFPTSYIPTEGSTKTRNPDKVSMTGTNFTDWYNQSEGTIFFNYKNLSTDISTIRGVWGLENSAGPVSGIRSPQSGATRIRLLYNNNFSPSESDLFFISTNYKKGVVAYNQTENRLMMDGTSDFVSATHTNDDTIVALSIGSRTTNGGSPLGGHIKSFSYYPTRLSNSQLVALTR
jgi:hypothetical protein